LISLIINIDIIIIVITMSTDICIITTLEPSVSFTFPRSFLKDNLYIQGTVFEKTFFGEFQPTNTIFMPYAPNVVTIWNDYFGSGSIYFKNYKSARNKSHYRSKVCRMLEYCAGTNVFLGDAINQIKYGILDKLGRFAEGKNIDAVHYSLYPDICAYSDTIRDIRRDLCKIMIKENFSGYKMASNLIESIYVDEIFGSTIELKAGNSKEKNKILYRFYWRLAELVNAHTN
jgi:hypothetical protein